MPEDRISQIRERYRETQKAGTPNIETPDIKTPDIKTPVTQDTNRISLIRERYQQMGMDSRPDNDQGSRPDNDQGWITNLSTGVEAGYDQMRGGLKYFGGEVVDWFDGEQPGTGDRWKKEAASILENAPQGDSFWYDFGSFLPQTVGSLAAILATPFTGGTSLAAIPAIIGTANIATIAGMVVGSSLHEYDQYTEEMGLETSEMVRLGTGLLNGAIEYTAEKIRLGRFLPKGGLVKKMTAKMVAKNPSLSKNILHKFAQQSPTGYRKYIKAGAYMLNQGKEEGLEELFTETAQSFVNMAYKGEDAWDDFGERAWKSFRGGAMMGIGIGTAGVWATNKTNTTRRKKHGVTLAEYVREKESMMDFVKAPDGSRPLESGVVEIAGTTKNGNYIGITPKGKQIELLPDQISKSITMSNDDFEAYNNALGENHAKAKEILDDVYVKDMTARIDGTVDEMEYFGGQDNAGNGKYFAASDEKGQAIGFVISGGLDTQTDGLSYLIVSDGQGGVKKDQIKSSKIHTIEEISRESIVNYLMTNAGIEKQNMDAQQKAQEAVEDEEVLTNDRVKTKHGNGVVTKMSEVGAVVQLDNGEEKIIPVEELEILRDGIDAEEESVIMKQGRPTDKGVEATSDRKINNEPSHTVQISAKKSVNIYPNEDGTQTIGEGYKDIDEAKAVVNALKKARPNLDKNGFEIINLNQGGDEWAAPEYVIRYSPKTLKDVQVKPTSELEDNRKTGSKESAIGDTRADDGKAGGEDVKTGELKTEVTPGDGVSAIQTGSEKPATGGESNRAGEEIKSNSREQIKGKVEKPLDEQLPELSRNKKGKSKAETGEVTQPTTQSVKSGVPELFESNPEFANAVYEALGYTQKNNTEAKKADINRRRQEELNTEQLLIDRVKRKNGAIGTQGVTTEQVTGILKNVLGLNVPENATMKDLVNLFISDKANVDKLLEFTAKNPINITELPDGTIQINDGHHRAFLLDQAGITELPATRNKSDEINAKYDAELDALEAQITPEQKQQAQQKFQEYVNSTGKQDIEGFKKFVTQPTPIKEVTPTEDKKGEIPTSPDGLYQIYTVKVKNKEGGIDNYFGVPSPLNKGERGFGDDLVNTLEQAIKTSEYNRFQEGEIARRKAEQEEADRKREAETNAKKKANKGKTKLEIMNEAKDAKILDVKLNYDGVIQTRREHVVAVINDGGHTETAEVNKVKDVSRTAYNRMDGRQQENLERRIKEGGKKTEYRLYTKDGTFYDITKAEYDYAQTLENQLPEARKKVKEPWEMTREEFVNANIEGLKGYELNRKVILSNSEHKQLVDRKAKGLDDLAENANGKEYRKDKYLFWENEVKQPTISTLAEAKFMVNWLKPNDVVVEKPVSEDKKVVAPTKPQGVKDTPKTQEKQRPAGEVLSELTDKKTPKVSGKDNKISTESAAKVDTPELSKKAQKMLNELQQGKPFNKVSEENELTEKEQIQLAKLFAESDKFPSKQYAKKDKIDIGFESQSNYDVKPIEKKITPIKDNSTASKISSLKSIVIVDDLRPIMKGVFKDAENNKLVATDAYVLIVIEDKTIKKSEVINPKTGEFIDDGANYPNYDAVIPRDNPLKRTVNVNEWLAQLNGLVNTKRFFSNPLGVRIIIGDNTYYFNSEKMQSVFQVFAEHGVENVELQFSDPTRALVVESNKGIMGLVLPIMGNADSKASGLFGYKTMAEWEYMSKEKTALLENEIKRLETRKLDKESKLQEAKKKLTRLKRTTPNGSEIMPAQWAVEYAEECVSETIAEIEGVRKRIKAIENPLQESLDIETVKENIENGTITKEQATEFIERPVEQPTEVEQSITDIEGKAESDNEAELNEVVNQADEFIKSGQIVSKQSKSTEGGVSTLEEEKTPPKAVEEEFDVEKLKTVVLPKGVTIYKTEVFKNNGEWRYHKTNALTGEFISEGNGFFNDNYNSRQYHKDSDVVKVNYGISRTKGQGLPLMETLSDALGSVNELFGGKIDIESLKKQPAVGGVSKTTTLEEKKITRATGIKPKNLRDTYKAGREVFGLNRSQALAQAIVVNTVVNKIAKNRGVTAEKVWGEIEFRKGSVQGKDVLYQQAKAAMFYSPTEKALTKIQQNKGTAEQFKAMLLKNGAKQAELDWMGFDEFSQDKKSLTKAEIQDWIDGNKVEIEEVQKTDIEDKWEKKGDNYKYGDYIIGKTTDGNWFVFYQGKREGVYSSLDGAKNYVEANTEANTKYSQYQLPGAPLSKYTEILTDKGWVKLQDININDIVLTRDDESGIYEWKPVLYKPEVYSEKLYWFKSQSISQQVTESHQMIVRKYRRTNDFGIKRIPAKELWSKWEYQIPLTANTPENKQYELFGKNAEDVAEFVGWFLSEGWFVKNRKNGNLVNPCISQDRNINPQNCDRIDKLLKRLKFNYTTSGSVYYINVKPIPKELISILKLTNGSANKFIPELFFKQTPNVINKLLKGLYLGDGSVSYRKNKNPHESYSSKSKRLVDGIQILLMLVGKSGNISYIKRDDMWAIKTKNRKWANVDKAKHSIIDYNDIAYCVTVDNHSICVRHEGICSWTGNSNYRELLLTMPSNGATITAAEKEELETLQRRMNNEVDFPENDYSRYEELMQKSRDSFDNKDQFKSSHFDERNILAHVRFNERTDSEGNKVLFIEEIQSDWAQEGKKKGFKNPITDKEISVKFFPPEVPEGKDPSEYPGYWETYDNRTGEMITRRPGNYTESQVREEAKRAYKANFESIQVPNMPFKKTDQWVNLTIRRMIRYAAENGFDRIAWTNGEQQAERYDLSKQVNEVYYFDNSDGTYSLAVRRKNEGVIYNEANVKQNKLPDIVGKELADKIISGENKNTQKGGAFDNWNVFSGLDLKVGGEGMEAFYNSIVPNAAKELGKKFGAKVEPVTLNFGNDIDNETGEAIPDNEQQVLSIQVTQSMKQSALNEGMTLFQNQQGTGKTAKGAIQFLADGNAIISALTNPNVSTPLHEIAHLYERYMPDSERKAVLKWAKHKTWSTETSEMFARGFEKYLATGKAPLPSLDGVFRRFKAWLTDIYNGITGSEIDIQLNDAMTDIYSAMLGADVVQKTTKNKNKVEKPVDDLLFQIAGESGAANLDKAERKQKQLGIVLKKNPMIDNIHTGIRTINDIKTAEEVFSESINDNEDATPDFTVDDMKAALESGRITVYSSKPIKNGVFISPSYMQAESYSGNKKVYSKEVSVNDVAWIDQFEGQLTEIDKAEEATTRLDNLGVAKKMESKFLVEQEKRETDAGLKHTWEISNEDALKIRMATGWEKGSDGEWRYEIPDYIRSVSDVFALENKSKGTVIHAASVFASKEVNIAYPQLNDITVRIDISDKENNTGSFSHVTINSKNASSEITVKATDVAKAQSILLHEIQHAIQEIEGFAKGGNPDAMKANLSAQEQVEYSNLLDDYKDLKDLVNDDTFGNETKKDAQKAIDRIMPRLQELDPNNTYKRLAGEVEARNVQNRINMSEEDRRGTPLKETEDTPRKDQIIYEGDDVKFMANQTGDPNFDSRHEPIIKGAYENALEIFHDNMRSVKTLQELITKRGGVMGEDLDTHLFENLTSSISKAEIENFEHSIQRRFLGAVKHIAGRYGIDADGIGIYLMAKHASERNKVMQMQGFKLEEGSGMSNVEAEAYIREFEGMVDQAYIKELLDSRSEVTGFTLRTLNKKGLITNDQYRKYKNQYTDYVPLRGWAGETASDIYKYIEDDINRDAPPMKHAKGRTSLADNPLPYMLSMAHAAIIMGNKNVMRTKALNMVRANSQMQDLFSENPIYEVKQDDGTTITTVNRPDQELFDQKKVTVIKDTRNLYKNTIHNASQHDVIVYDNGEKKVISFTDPVVARSINSENIMAKDFVSKILSPTVGRVQRFISANFTSKNPAFVPVNWTRDFGYAYFSHFVKGDKGDAKYFRKSMMNSFKAVSRHLKHNLGTTFSEEAINDAQIKISNGESLTNADYDALYYSFKMNGGETGYVHLKNIKNFKKDIEKELRLAVGNPTRWEAANNYAPIKKAGEWMEYMAQMSENQARFSTYLVSMSKGKSHAQSASDAKNITVNFNRRGKVSGLMGNLYVFFNANVQGVANIGKLAKDHPKAFAKLGAGFMTMGFLSALLTRMWADDDDDENAFDKIPTYIKYNFWVLPNPAYYLGYGEKKEKFLTIPLPHGFRAVYALGVMAYEAATGTKGAGDIAIDLVTNTADSFSPITSLNPDEMLKGDITLRPIVPSWMMPFYDINVNRDFAGRMVYKEPFTKALEKKIPGSEQSLPNVNPLLKNAARGLNRLGGGDLNRTAAIGFNPKTTKVDAERNEWKWLIYDWNPSKAEHLLEYYLGGKGKFFNNIYKTTRDATLSVINKENQMNEYTTPILRRFIYTPYTKDTPDKYWELKNEISTWKGLYNDAKSNKDIEMMGRFQKNRRMMELINEFDRSEKRIKDMNERIDRSINPEMKKKLIKDRRMIIKDFLNKSKEIDKRHENSNR